MVDVRLFLVYFSLQLHHHHHHLVAYLAPRHGAQAPHCPSPPLRDVGPLSGGQRELRRTTGWAKRRRHDGANDDTKRPATTRWARRRREELDDAKSPTTRRARRREEPDAMVSPNSEQALVLLLFFFNLFLIPLHQEGLSPPWNFFIFLQLLCDPLGTILNVVGQMDIWLYTR